MIAPEADDVHVWSIALGNVEPAPEQLTVAEWERYSRLAEDDRRQLAGTRAALRGILGAYLAGPPASVQLIEAEKPRLADGELEFSVAHSAALGLVAVARVPVGVDVERIEAIAGDEFADLVGFVLAPAERAELMTLPDSERVAAYYRVWTRKEAYVKATGKGIARQPLPEVIVGVPAPTLLAVEGVPPMEVAAWTVLDLAAPADYAASLVVRHRHPRVSVRPWPP